MEDAELWTDASLRMKKFEKFISEIKGNEIQCDNADIYSEMMECTNNIRDLILSALTAKLTALNNETSDKDNKHGKYVKLEEFEARKHRMNVMIAEKDEIESQIKEMSQKMEILVKNIELIKRIKSGRKKISDTGIHLIGIEIMKEFRKVINALPIYGHRSDIVDLVKNNQFIVLKGETGSGKSTQLAQYIMEGIITHGNMKVICTQPRKVAAVSLANRIAEEQFQKVGEQVGYWVGMRKCCSEKTRLLLMTDQMLLNHCLENPQLDDVSCVIIDEAHERSINIDLLLGMVKSASQRNKDLKVIVTSATISTSMFSSYLYGCPVVHIPGRMYPVEVQYEGNADGIDYLKRAVTKAIELHHREDTGDILVFLTTPVEVDNAVEAFAKASRDMKDCTVLPLHGKLQPDQQMRVFQPCENRKRKIVFSTNVAETSVTIPGIKFVIDCGMAKEKFYDAKKGISYLEIKMISKSSAIQRMGRAGRTGPGLCVRLYDKKTYDHLDEATLPEIKKVHLGSAVLKLMALGIPDVKKFDFIERPDEASLSNSINVLKMLQAIDTSGKITELGRKLAKLPLEPRAAKIVLDGIEGGCRDEAVKLAAAMVYSSNVFFRPGGEEEKKLSETEKVQFSNKDGDLISLVEIYEDWEKQGNTKAKNQWCCKKYLNAKTMRSMKELITDINSSLKEVTISLSEARPKSYEETQSFLKDLLISAHYDNIACFTGHERIGYWSPTLDERFLIHPSSVLCSLGMQPKFVIFQDVLKTSRNFITGITPVDERSVLRLCPIKEVAIDFDRVEKNKVIERELFPLGPSVVKALIGRGGVNIKEIEAMITENGRAPGLVTMNVEERKVTIYATKERLEFAEASLKERITNEMRLLEDEVKEEGFGQKEMGYRVLMKAGGEIQEILMESESRILVIEVMKRSEDEVVKPDVMEEISNQVSKKINEIQDVKRTKREVTDGKSSVKVGQITFSKIDALENAKKMLDFVYKEYHIHAFSPTHRADNRSKSFVKIKVRWSRRRSRGFGFVRCSSDSVASTVLHSINEVYLAKIDRKDPTQVYVRNIDCSMDKEEFKKSVEDQTKGIEGIVDSYIVYSESSAADLNIEADGYRMKLQEIINEQASYESITVFPITSTKVVVCNANIQCRNFEDAERIVCCLDGSYSIGTQRCHASIDLREQFCCSLSLFKAIEGKLDEIKATIKKSTTKINIGSKGKKFKVVTITGEESFAYKIALRHLRDLLNGELLEGKNVSFLCYDLLLPKILKLEKEVGGKVEYDKRLDKFRIYGNPETRKLLENKLKEMYDKASENTDRIMLKGKGRAPGLMKGLMKKYGPNLLELMPSKDCGILELNIRRQVISISASNDVIEEVKKSVNEYNEQLQGVSNLGLHQSEDEGDQCPLCFCQVEKPMFVLQSCGHAYCTECLKQYLESSISDKKFPMSCCEENCGRRLVLKDLNLLIESKTERDSLLEGALDHFVMMNSTSYKYCPTPNCSIAYRISDEEMARPFSCPDCSKETCTACHQNSHRNFSSCAAWREFNNNKDLYEWAGNKDCRKCPKCGIMIEKNGGCRHMSCKCGAHICWGCMAVFSSGSKCYDHQSSCTRILPPQAYQRLQTERERPVRDASVRATTTSVAGTYNRTNFRTTHEPRPASSQNAAQTGRVTSTGVAGAMAATRTVASAYNCASYETAHATRSASSKSTGQTVRGLSVANSAPTATTTSAADSYNRNNYRLMSTSRPTSSQSTAHTVRDTSVGIFGTRATTTSAADAYNPTNYRLMSTSRPTSSQSTAHTVRDTSVGIFGTRATTTSAADAYNPTNYRLMSTSRPTSSQSTAHTVRDTSVGIFGTRENAIHAPRERNMRDPYRKAYDHDNHLPNFCARSSLSLGTVMHQYRNNEREPTEAKKRNCTIL